MKRRQTLTLAAALAAPQAGATCKLHVHRFAADRFDPTLVGDRRPVFWNEGSHSVAMSPEPQRGVA